MSNRKEWLSTVSCAEKKWEVEIKGESETAANGTQKVILCETKVKR